MKMYFLLNTVIFHPAMFVYQRVFKSPSKCSGFFPATARCLGFQEEYITKLVVGLIVEIQFLQGFFQITSYKF